MKKNPIKDNTDGGYDSYNPGGWLILYVLLFERIADAIVFDPRDFYVDFVIFSFISIPSTPAYSFISFQKCLNGIGDFFCECAFGYKLDKSGNCKAESFHGKAILYFSGVTEIRSREISDNNHYALITDDHSKVRQAIGEKYTI